MSDELEAVYQSRIEDLERQLDQAKMTVAAMVLQSGGVFYLSHSTIRSVSPHTVLEQSEELESATIVYRVKEQT